ncbi:MAG: molecular chaperone DnaJ [Patescibacteria group bacterium]|nr:molecular chaperone DnaJ [Patescibacteria group bacterium]
MAKDYYDILGVTKTSSPDELKKAYYKLAHKYHPHKGGTESNEAKMKEVNEAYSVLGNPQKKEQYDKYGQTFDRSQGQGQSSGFGGFNDFSDFAQAYRSGQGSQNGQNFSFDFGDLGDMFGDMFGGRSRAATQQNGGDIQAELTLNFREAVFGVEKKISLRKAVTCNHCHGDGAEPGSKVSACPTCGGRGQVVRNIGFGIGFPSACQACEGTGKKIDKHCKECRGQGVIKETEEILVKIPAGIDNDQTIRLSGQGEAGLKGAAAGDLYIKIRVLPEIGLNRDGADIRTVQQISFSQAALGAKIDVETLDGMVTLKIPEGTQSDKIFQIKGKGVPHLQDKGRGDHLVKVVVKTPTKLNRRQRELLAELDK